MRRRTDTLQTCRPAQARADLVARERSRIRLRRMPRISNAALWSAWIAARTSRPVFQRPQRSASATAAGPVAGPFVMGFRCQSVSEPQGVVQQLLTGSTEYGRETQRCRRGAVAHRFAAARPRWLCGGSDALDRSRAFAGPRSFFLEGGDPHSPTKDGSFALAVVRLAPAGPGDASSGPLLRLTPRPSATAQCERHTLS